MGMMTGIPLIRIETAVQNRGVMGFPFRRRRGGGGPPEDLDPEDDDGTPRGFRGRWGPRGYPGPQGPEGPRGPLGLMGPRGIPGGLSSTGLGDTVLQSPNVSTIAVEKFIAVCRRIPISVDANSAERKPKYGRSPKFNSRSARHADSRTNQVGLKIPVNGSSTSSSTLYQYTMERIRISSSHGLLS